MEDDFIAVLTLNQPYLGSFLKKEPHVKALLIGISDHLKSSYVNLDWPSFMALSYHCTLQPCRNSS